MDIVRSTRELQARADAERQAGRRIGLVPTMGALHAGHLSLVAEARRHADQVWVSIFVNPTQFNQAADLAAYPRTWDEDLAACREAGVDLVFAPTPEEMYPEGSDTTVAVDDLARPLCGAARPGHFTGVTTIVAKLFLAAKPHVAVFGEKDYQQLAVIRRMARDLGFDLEVLGGETVREPDGLALSSRNLRLDSEARAQAVVLSRALEAAQGALLAGEASPERLLALVRREIAKAPRAEIDYAELRDPDSLEPVGSAIAPGQRALLALAVFVQDRDGGDAVRLIDNRVLLRQPNEEDLR